MLYIKLIFIYTDLSNEVFISIEIEIKNEFRFSYLISQNVRLENSQCFIFLSFCCFKI